MDIDITWLIDFVSLDSPICRVIILLFCMFCGIMAYFGKLKIEYLVAPVFCILLLNIIVDRLPFLTVKPLNIFTLLFIVVLASALLVVLFIGWKKLEIRLTTFLKRK